MHDVHIVRRPKIQLVEDGDGVRIDVTSPQRVDLALSEGHKRFAHRNPDLEAKWLRMAEAFVRGEKSSRERTHSDSLFQINASARQRDAPWDLIRLRVSVPGDITGALSVHRWVTEGVELLYRLPPEHRDYMREAVATNERRTDEERHARYEELLAWGMATMSELPFYRRVTPRRPRRSAEPPASPIPFFAKRSGNVPGARRPTIAGVRLPPGRRAPDSFPSYWISDEPLEECGSIAASIARAFAETGLWPLLWPPDEDPAAYLDQPIEPDRVDAVDVEAVFRRGWDRIAAHPAGLVEPIGPDFPGLATGSPVDPGAAPDPFHAAGLVDVSARLMIVPCNRPADCVALIGGLAVEADTAGISAVIRSWEERFGAVLVAVEPSHATLAVTAPPTTPEQALAVAAERFAFCPPETVEPGSLQQYSSLLPSASVWPVAWYD